MDKSQLYRNSSNELSTARDCQLNISQKELELQLAEIQGRRGYFTANNHNEYALQLKFSALKNEIDTLIYSRDSHINNAVNIALDIVTYELEDNTNGVFSIGSLAVGAINSFISSYTIDFRLSVVNNLKLSRISSKLLFAGIGYLPVKSKIDELKRLTRTY